MEQVIKKLNEIVFLCEKKIRTADENISLCALNSKKNKETSERLVEEEKKIKLISDELKKYIDVGKAEDQLKDIEEKIKSSLAELNKKISEFDSYKDAEIKRLKEIADDLLRKQQKIEKAQLDLDADKKTYKMKILDSVGSLNLRNL